MQQHTWAAYDMIREFCGRDPYDCPEGSEPAGLLFWDHAKEWPMYCSCGNSIDCATEKPCHVNDNGEVQMYGCRRKAGYYFGNWVGTRCKFPKCRTCPLGMYQTAPCRELYDTGCAKCRVCGSTQYDIGGCQGEQDRQCESCMSPLASCGSGRHRVFCGYGDEGTCAPCDAPCVHGYFYTSVCNGTANNQCQKCSVCSESQVLVEQCTNETDTVCLDCDNPVIECPKGEFRQGCAMNNSIGHCSKCKECGEAEYLESGCSGTSDSVCKTCTQCEDFISHFMVSPCKFDSDTVCVPCRSCSSSEFEVAPCSLQEDTTCASCESHSLLTCHLQGKDYFLHGCGYGSLGSCKPCNQCPVGSTLATYGHCSPIRDNVCRPCTECRVNQTQIIPCTHASDRVCKDCTSQCGQGQYMTYAAACSPLPGYCTPCSKCPMDSFRIRSCTENADTLCVSCKRKMISCMGTLLGCTLDSAGICINDEMETLTEQPCTIELQFKVKHIDDDTLLDLRSIVASSFALPNSSVTLTYPYIPPLPSSPASRTLMQATSASVAVLVTVHTSPFGRIEAVTRFIEGEIKSSSGLVPSSVVVDFSYNVYVDVVVCGCVCCYFCCTVDESDQ
eukprot:95466-Hanusia_phi.AAC.11